MFRIYRKPRQMVCVLLAMLIIFAIFPPQYVGSQTEKQEDAKAEKQANEEASSLPDKLKDIEAKDAVIASQFVSDMNVAEWLGPLAPVALSPFFAITLLSGAAVFGQDWIPDNPLLGENSPLNSPVMFWTFLVLTIVTSLPRFSKVSKPIAQACDFLETYSAIITLVVIKIMMMVPTEAEPETVVVQAGVISFSWDVVLMIAMVINVIVINTVKFFFEFLIWITPIPFLDACFEVANKTVCLGLTALYTWSPLLATILNLGLFAICFVMFRWIKRRVTFYRTVLIDLVWGWFDAKRGEPKTAELVVFPRSKLGSIPAKSRCTVLRTEEGWTVTQKRLLLSSIEHCLETDATPTPQIKKGFLTCSLDFDEETKLVFSRRYHKRLDELAELMGATCCVDETEKNETKSQRLEFA